MRITIATGIYPPEIGGPAEYAKNLKDIWVSNGHKVKVRVFSRFNFLPTGVRHLVYFLYILPSVAMSDCVLALDTFSSALPAVLASKLFGKKIILRTGGDFLWEAYVERTWDLVLLRNFYKTRIAKLSIKEKKIFSLIGFVLRNVSAVIWNTEWQREIFVEPYSLKNQKHFIVENYYGPKVESFTPTKKNFIAGTRPLKWKNGERLKRVFESSEIKGDFLEYDDTTTLHQKFLEKIQHSYAVIIATLGDIGPNTIIDAIRCNKPFILTVENGLTPRIKDIAIFVDPESEEDIKQKVMWLSNEANYQMQKRKIEEFTFTHTWEEMAEEYLAIYKKI
jgi:hypothetical protein